MRPRSIRLAAFPGALAFLIAAGAAPAPAQVASTANTIQSLYYKELAKDGRIYVFNSPVEAERFEKSGELGRAITRVGAGPNGETVVGDSETALELFFFKHGIAEAVDRPKDAPLNVAWRDGKTRITAGKGFYLEMSNRVQVRYTHELPDDAVRLAGTADPGDGKGSFRIRRAKFKLEGWFYRPELEYELQLNWPDVTGSPASRFLEDANLDWDLSKRKALRVRFGQFKAPYGRQELTSSGSQQFVDRSIVSERYSPGRETGLALWGTLGSTRLDWRAMASNGNGRSQAANDNDRLLYTARLQYQLLGRARMNQWGSGALMTEGDLGDSAEGPLLALAGSFLRNDRRFTSADTVNDDTQWSADYSFKYAGFASVGEYHFRSSTPYTAATAGPGFDDQGFLVQASYAFKAPGPAGSLEVAGRYAQLDPNDTRAGDRRSEVGGAISWYYNRHPFKVQADFRRIRDDARKAGEQTAHELRLQTQFIF